MGRHGLVEWLRTTSDLLRFRAGPVHARSLPTGQGLSVGSSNCWSSGCEPPQLSDGAEPRENTPIGGSLLGRHGLVEWLRTTSDLVRFRAGPVHAHLLRADRPQSLTKRTGLGYRLYSGPGAFPEKKWDSERLSFPQLGGARGSGEVGHGHLLVQQHCLICPPSFRRRGGAPYKYKSGPWPLHVLFPWDGPRAPHSGCNAGLIGNR